MKNKIWKNLEKLIIFLLLISFLGCQSGIVYGMNYGGAEFSPRPSPSPSSGGGSSSSGNNNGNTDASSSNESTVSIPSYVGIEGYVKENVESVNSTKIGKENDEASVDSTEVPLRDVTVKYVDNAGREFSTTTDGDGKYQFGIDRLGSGEHTYHIEYTYPNTSEGEINSIDTVDAAKIIQQKLKYNGQDYMGGESKEGFKIIETSGKSAAQVYLVLDCSYSMDTEIEIKENNNTYKITKLEIEKRIAKNIINSLLTGEKNIYIGLVVFTGVCYRRVALTNNVDTLTNALDGEIEFSDKGYTNILGALDKANESFINRDANNSNKYMFLLSDGLPTSDGNKENTLYRVDYSSPDAASLIAENDAKLEKIAQNTKTKLENIENNDKVKVFSVITNLEDEKDKNMLDNIFKNNKNDEYNKFYNVDSIENVSKEIVKEFEKYVKESIETIDNGYSLNKVVRKKIKDNFETFTYENTNCFQALDMEIKTSNLEEFKEYAKKLFDKTSITITSKECTANLYCNPLPEPNPKVETNEDGEVVHKTYYVQSEVWLTAPDIYLTKLPQYTITPKISVTGLAVVASTGTVIDRQVTTTEEAENLISTIEKDLLYGSTAVVRYTVDVTNTSLYNDTKTVSILFYVPDGFTCDTKSVSAVGIGENNKKQKLNITKITSLTADTIDDSDIKGLLSKKAIKKIREGNDSEQPTSAIAVTVQVKDDSHYVLPTNGSIKININTTKLLGNDEEMSYGADAEILSYSNDSFKRIEYKAKASSSAVSQVSQVAVAGNGSTKEKDYTKTSNRGIILLPTGGDKRMLKQRILLVILVSACGIIIYKLKKSEKDKHNK